MEYDASFRHFIELCRTPMEQLQQRFDLRAKNILSIGAGDCFEEYWWSQANRITAVDISDCLREHLALPVRGRTNDRYFVEDAAMFVDECKETFDLGTVPNKRRVIPLPPSF
jgi:spermidine synthase